MALSLSLKHPTGLDQTYKKLALAWTQPISDDVLQNMHFAQVGVTLKLTLTPKLLWNIMTASHPGSRAPRPRACFKLSMGWWPGMGWGPPSGSSNTIHGIRPRLHDWIWIDIRGAGGEGGRQQERAKEATLSLSFDQTATGNYVLWSWYKRIDGLWRGFI